MADLSDVKYTGQEQLVRSRYFKRDTDREPIFEGLVPVAFKIDRAKGLRWLELKAAADAEAEAAEAEARARAANPPEQPDAVVLVEELRGQLAQQSAALDALEGWRQGLVVATPELVLSNAAQLHRVAGLAADIEAQSLAHQQQAQALMDQVAQRQSELEGRVGQVAEEVGALVSDVRGQTAQMLAEGARKLASAISKRITGFELQAAQLRGPKGNTGAPGTSVALLPRDPRKMSAEELEQRFRRPIIPGDQGDVQIPEGLQRWIWTGEVWEQGALVPVKVEVQSRRISVLDQSTKVFAAPGATPTVSSFGSGGGQRPDARIAVAGTQVALSNSDAWSYALKDAGINDLINACHLLLTITAMDSVTYTGESYYLVASFVYRKVDNSFEWTFSSELGALVGKINPTFEFRRRTATPGPTYSGPSKAVTSMELLMGIDPLSSGATQFLLSGAIEWLVPENAHVVNPTGGVTAFTPAWVIS